MAKAELDGHHSDMIAAPGWSAVYVRDAREFVWPLVAWFRPDSGPLMVGLTLSPDGRAIVRADEIEGFKRYLAPAEWLDHGEDSRAPKG
jgi:hypothetical protein